MAIMWGVLLFSHTLDHVNVRDAIPSRAPPATRGIDAFATHKHQDVNACRGERAHFYGALRAVGGADGKGRLAGKDELLDKGETVEPARSGSAESKELKPART